MAERLRRMTQAQAYLFQVYSCREICVGSIPALIIHLFALFTRFGTIDSSFQPRHTLSSVRQLHMNSSPADLVLSSTTVWLYDLLCRTQGSAEKESFCRQIRRFALVAISQ
jgi:hypothetical protein